MTNPTIPAEAVEVATNSLIESLKADELGWVDADTPNEVTIDIRGFDLVSATRAVLEAAAPHMLADAWEQGFRACNGEWEQTADIVTPDEDRFVAKNPYRSAK